MNDIAVLPAELQSPWAACWFYCDFSPHLIQCRIEGCSPALHRPDSYEFLSQRELQLVTAADPTFCLCDRVPYVNFISQLPNKFMGILPHPRVYNLINSLISWVHLFIESDLSDTDNIVPFENTAAINQNNKVKIKERRADWSD